MSKQSFTPGPWKWWTSNSFLRLSSEATGKDGDVIDSYKMSDGHTSLSVKYEDMRLIAAAPDLLEALQDMLAGWEYIRANHGDLYGVGWDRAQNKANSAINKALGK